MNSTCTRREWLAGAPAAMGIGLAAGLPQEESFGYCLNTSTLQGQKLDLVEVVEIAAKAGYQAIEPWLSELDRYVKNGGSPKVLGQRIRDRGMSVPSAIAFSNGWSAIRTVARRAWKRPAAAWNWCSKSAASASRHRPPGRRTRRTCTCSRPPSGTAFCWRSVRKSVSYPRWSFGGFHGR